MTRRQALAAAALIAVAVPPAGAAGVIYGIHYMEQHMYFRDTPTGRQADTWRDQNLRQQINEALNCEADFGDPDCDPEGVEVP